jgi:agmatinase
MIPVLLGVPFDTFSSHLRGAAAAPGAIRAALVSTASNTWSEAGRDVMAPGGLQDDGDLVLGESAAAFTAIASRAHELAARGRAPLVLGGDHSITYPVVDGLHRAGRRFSVLHVDAHPDLYDVYDGNPLSHACPFARIMEAGLVERLVQVGVRTMNGHQRHQADRLGVEVIDMPRWARGDRPDLSGPVYVSIDLDGLDPAFAPGVSHREPGGLSTREVIGLIQDLGGPVIGADVVEFNPSQDLAGLTAWVAAKLVKELAGACLASDA